MGKPYKFGCSVVSETRTPPTANDPHIGQLFGGGISEVSTTRPTGKMRRTAYRGLRVVKGHGHQHSKFRHSASVPTDDKLCQSETFSCERSCEHDYISNKPVLKNI